MNIAYVIDSLEGGGAERVVRQLAAGLARNGDRAFIYCLKNADCCVADLESAGVIIREARSSAKDFALVARLIGWMRRDEIQIVNAHSSAAFCWSIPPAKYLGIPLVITRHGAHLGKQNFYPRWADRLLPLADRVIIVAEDLRRALPFERVAREAVPIPNGIDRDAVGRAQARSAIEQACGRTLDGPIILSVGTVCPEKDPLNLLVAFASLRLRRPDVNLVIAGAERGQEYCRTVHRRITDLNLHDSVHLLGHVPDAWRLMAGADVFCQSSRTEAAPIAIIEAMSQNVPVVATAVGAVGALDVHDPSMLLHQNQTALLVEPASPDALTEALSRVLHDPRSAAQRARKAAVIYKTRFISKQMIQGYRQVYERCIARSKRASRIKNVQQEKPGVVMLGPAPPLIGGMVTSIGLLMKSPLSRAFRLHRLGTTVAPRCDRKIPGIFRGCRALWRHARALAGLMRLLRCEKIDVLHVHTCSYTTFYRNLFDVAAAKLLRRKTVLHIRGNLFERFCRDAGRIGRWIIRRGLESADAVIVLSHGWRDALEPYAGSANLVVVPNAFDSDVVPTPAQIEVARRERFAADPDSPCRFLFMALVREIKGVGDLIEAARLLRDEGVPFEIHVAGPFTDGDERRWRTHVREADLDVAVKFIGSVSGPEKARALAAADVFVHPSHSEGLPNSVLEGGAAGLPVIATTVGAVPEVYYPPDLEAAGEDLPIGPIVPPRDPAALAREMRRLAQDENLRKQIGARMKRRFDAYYSIDRLAERITPIYRDILAGRAPQTGAEYGVLKKNAAAAPLMREMSAADPVGQTPKEKADAATCR